MQAGLLLVQLVQRPLPSSQPEFQMSIDQTTPTGDPPTFKIHFPPAVVVSISVVFRSPMKSNW